MAHTIPTGQWIGRFQGPSPGFLTLNIDQNRRNRGFAAIVQNGVLPATRIDLEIEFMGNSFRGSSIQIRAFDLELRRLLPAKEYAKRHTNVIFSNKINFEGKLQAGRMIGQWCGNPGIQGDFDLFNTSANPAQPANHVMSWNEYKGFVGSLIRDNQERIFRGHSDSQWKLQTSFHRHFRYDLHHYDQHDIAEVAHHMNGLPGHRYDRSSPEEYGALLSTAQHHGFPTPLLDWTQSPYVAAFFGFEGLPKSSVTDGFSRVFVFDDQAWASEVYQSNSIADPHPTITIREFSAHNNPRLLPQQSVHVFTNVADIEWWVRYREQLNSKRYLEVIDIPHAERAPAMRELRYMGVSAATLFPGLEGVCRAMREKHFVW